MEIRSAYSERERTPFHTGEESKVKQSFKDDADINKIVKRFDQTGQLPRVATEGSYLDVSEIGDFRQALEQVRATEDFFMGLPAKVRAEFDNDPANLLEAMQDPENFDALSDMGMTIADADGVVYERSEVEEPADSSSSPAQVEPAGQGEAAAGEGTNP